jgi:hypothetical protein
MNSAAGVENLHPFFDTFITFSSILVISASPSLLLAFSFNGYQKLKSVTRA